MTTVSLRMLIGLMTSEEVRADARAAELDPYDGPVHAAMVRVYGRAAQLWREARAEIEDAQPIPGRET